MCGRTHRISAVEQSDRSGSAADAGVKHQRLHADQFFPKREMQPHARQNQLTGCGCCWGPAACRGLAPPPESRPAQRRPPLQTRRCCARVGWVGRVWAVKRVKWSPAQCILGLTSGLRRVWRPGHQLQAMQGCCTGGFRRAGRQCSRASLTHLSAARDFATETSLNLAILSCWCCALPLTRAQPDPINPSPAHKLGVMAPPVKAASSACSEAAALGEEGSSSAGTSAGGT